jgi:Ricin-type beta-trefoil lectin domain
VSLMAVAVAAACACAAEPSSPSAAPPGAHVEGALGAPANKWTLQAIPVCYSDPPFDVQNLATLKAAIRMAVENSWGRLGGISFVNWAACTGADLHSIQIHWVQLCLDKMGDTNGLGYTPTGNNWTSICAASQSDVPGNIVPLTPLDVPHATLSAIHEFGHLLGYDHENSVPSIMSSNVATLTQILHSGYIFPTPTDIVRFQSDYGRKPQGTIVTSGNHCLDVPMGIVQAGSAVWSWECNGNPISQLWRFSSTTGALNAPPGTGAFVLDVPALNFVRGQTLQTYPPNGGSNQNFERRDMALRGPGDLCMARISDIPDSFANGTPVGLLPCTGEDPQAWRSTFDNPTVVSTIDGWKCLDAGNPSGVVYIQDCQANNPNQVLSVLGTGHQLTLGPNHQCLTAGPTVSAPVTLAPCTVAPAAPDVNQQWYWSGPVRPGGGIGLCLDLANGSLDNGTQVRLESCNGSEAQRFDYYQ